MRKANFVSLAIIVLAVLLGIIVYPYMPDQISSHWNASGEVNGHVGKFWGLFLLPLISLILFVIFLAIPKLDPLKSNIEIFRKEFDRFINVFTVFLFYIYSLTIMWNLGLRFNMSLMLVPALAALFYYLGILIGKAKRNWFIGIRTPWTLSSEKIWDRTHEVGGKLFRASGILMLSGLVFQSAAIYIIIGLALITAVWSVVYSYVLWTRSR